MTAIETTTPNAFAPNMHFSAGSIPWPMQRIDAHTGYQCLAATRLNHQPATRPYMTVLQVIEHDDDGYPIKWVVRNAYFKHDVENRCMVPDGYGNGSYFWHGAPLPKNKDGDPIQPYFEDWQRAIKEFNALAADALMYDIKMMTFGRTDPLTGQRLGDE